MKTTRSDIDRAAFQTFSQNNEPDFGRTALFEGILSERGMKPPCGNGRR